MTVEQLISEMTALTPSERLKVVQAIWDELPWDVGAELTTKQEEELERRWAAYQADKSTALTEDEFKKRIRIARGK